MGVCSAKGRQESKKKGPELEDRIIEPQNQPNKITQQVPNREQEVKELFILFKRFSDTLDLIGNLDQLRQETRLRLAECITIRSNVNIITNQRIKAMMKDREIIKRVEETDQYLVYNDEEFTYRFSQEMRRLTNLILTELKDDEEFESHFPILCVSFVDLAQKINEIVGQNKLSPHKKSSLESFGKRTTYKMSLQQ
ncbi:hypothetical protein pb186bvf_015171 [Paramecium bursaria]